MKHIEKIEKMIGEAIGEASMCWTELPQGEFESDRAKKIVERLVGLHTTFIQNLIQRVEEKQKTVRLEQFTVDTIIKMLKEEI